VINGAWRRCYWRLFLSFYDWRENIYMGLPRGSGDGYIGFGARDLSDDYDDLFAEQKKKKKKKKSTN